MPLMLDPADRKLLRIAGAAFFLLLIAVALLAPATGGNDAGVPSSYSAAPGGARAAYLLLQQLQLPVQRWQRSPVELPFDSAPSVLVLADPAEAPNAEERRALLRFVQRGGRVLFTGLLLTDFFPPGHTSEALGDSKNRTYSPAFPSVFTRGAANVTFRPEATWGRGDVGTAVVLYGDAAKPVAVSWSIGAGRILWWSAPTPLTNANIAKQNNLKLLLDAVRPTRNSSQPTIYWDEYFHGERPSLWSYMATTPVPWLLAQLALLGGAVFVTFGLRSGPLRPAPKVSRLWPLEFVDTLGALYRRAKATGAAVSVVYSTFRAELTHRLRLPSSISDSTLGDAVEQRLGWHSSGISRTLERAAALSRGQHAQAAEALEIVQELEYLRKRLGLSKTPERRP